MRYDEDLRIDPIGSESTLTDAIYEKLLEAIYQGRLAPGSVVNEAALAQEFGVSRGPVREAIRRLQGVQLLTRQAYAKSRVLALSAAAGAELFELRMALEGMACHLAARHMTDLEIDLLLSELERSRGHAPEGTAKVFDFHERIARGSGNTRIVNALCGDLYHLLRMYRRHSTREVVERKEDAYDEHWQILRAIKARTPCSRNRLCARISGARRRTSPRSSPPQTARTDQRLHWRPQCMAFG